MFLRVFAFYLMTMVFSGLNSLQSGVGLDTDLIQLGQARWLSRSE
jgi:hypothetical protein